MPVYDYIIVGGGSAGSVLAHRLSARSANKVLLCEAGQDTPPGKEPPEIADSYSGTAYFDPRFHWTELKVHTQVVSHNNPQENRPPLRKYEQARVLGGGSSINGQMANRGAPTDYDEWASARRRGLGLERRAALLQEGRARPRLRRALCTARTAASPCAASRPSTGPATPRRWPRASRPRASNSCPTRTASSSTATSRSPIPTPRSGACRRRWAISTPRRASAPTSRSRPTPRSSRCCSRARAASA